MAASLSACDAAASSDPLGDEDVQALVEQIVEADERFSGIALVSRQGQMVGLAVQGLADQNTHQPVTPETLFSIASVGKMLTAQTIDLLVRQDRLAFETPVSQILPEFADTLPVSVTVDTLLQHRSGLSVAGEPSDDTLDAVRNNHDLFRLYFSLGLSSQGPADFRYENGNYVLLGEIIERVTGQGYEDFATETVLAAQGLSTPRFLRLDTAEPEPVARPYMPVDFETWWNSDDWIRGESAADYTHLAPANTPSAGGGALATGPDMARLIARLANSSSGERLCGLIPATQPRGYGRGCQVRHDTYGRRFGHTGSTAGVQARVFAYPDRGYEIIVLSNHDGEASPVFNALETGLFGRPD
nr:serine hydrolase domain-containing protein [Maricaulis parjimensis]